MHLNPLKPNILADMRVAAQRRDLRNAANGLFPAKRTLISHKSYPYASERQTKRQRRHQDYLCNKVVATAMFANRDISPTRKALIRLSKQLLQAETGL